ncbi:cyclic nucleotide-binding domain-containing protein [Actinomadura sp. 7K507]|uniref:cyclic nucleotide-binding domain-containing protein n=1 Tax=Actinomadura sp. 7K507 TaxID=2530365 RepID=UPI0010484F37|nr:cyclic nucleotide-binding domain-containing protein [Actinomadura sp. 7K507]TDC76537.1 cyclic nucleotide-binding domain-containing protein [Actinomadura sp. 7K507]
MARMLATVKPLGLLSGIAAILAAGGAIAGAAGLISAGMLVLIGIPVAGFTRNQWLATTKGLQFAVSVDDVQALKRTDAAAFTQPIAALRRRPPDETGDVSGADETEPREAYALLDPPRRDALQPAAPPPPPAAGERMLDEPSGERSHASSGTRRNFWDSLTKAERDRLTATARTVEFPPGAVVWHRGEVADHVILLQSGWTKVYGGPDGEERIIATRGPGDLIGERAALHPTSRSATVVAMDTVRGLLITTERFYRLVEAHPDLLGVIEAQLYQRLNDAPDGRCSCERDGLERANAVLPAPVLSRVAWNGQNCSILFTDIAAFGGHQRGEQDRRFIRKVMYDALRDACESSGVPWADCHHEDRGDGVLIVVPPSTPTGLIVHPLLSHLAKGLGRHNHRASEAVRIQLRAALHVGPVVSDAEGVTGDAIIYTARLLEASGLKRRLAEEGAPVGFITSQFVYDAFLRHGSGDAGGTEYRRVDVQVKETRVSAWACLIGAGQREPGPASV